MSAAEAVFEAFKALWTADTASGGLNDSSADGSAKLWAFLRDFDPQAHPSRRRNEDHAVLDSNMQARHPFGDRRAWLGTARLHVFLTRDKAADKFDAVDARIREVFDRGSLANPGWVFGKPHLLGSMRVVGQSGEVTHAVAEFLVHVEKAGE